MSVGQGVEEGGWGGGKVVGRHCQVRSEGGNPALWSRVGWLLEKSRVKTIQNEMTGCCKSGSLWQGKSRSFWETRKRLCKRRLCENFDE